MAFLTNAVDLEPDVPDAKRLQGCKKCWDEFKEEKPLGGNRR